MTATAEASVKPADLVADDSARSAEAVAGRPPVPEQLVGWRDPSPRVGWIITAAVTAIAALTRLWALDWPKGKMFDEIYYATEAQELLRYGYEDNRGYMFVVHPPLGKWLIAGTSAIFGNNEVGWRLAPALAGIVSVLLLVRIARRMFRSNVFGWDRRSAPGPGRPLGRAVPRRIARHLLAAVHRRRLRGAGSRSGTDALRGWPACSRRALICPTAYRRWDRDPGACAGGVLLGLACAVKWSALSFFVLFAVLTLMWDRGALKSAGVTRSWRSAARRSWLPAVGSLVVAPTAAYLFTWLGWFAGENSWNRHWADSHPSATRLDILGIRIPFNWGFLPAGHTVARRLSPQCLPVPRGARFAACVRVQALELADPRATGQLLLSGRRRSGLRCGGLFAGGSGHRHAGAVVGIHSGARLAGLALAHQPGLARGCGSRRVRRPAGSSGCRTPSARCSCST